MSGSVVIGAGAGAAITVVGVGGAALAGGIYLNDKINKLDVVVAENHKKVSTIAAFDETESAALLATESRVTAVETGLGADDTVGLRLRVKTNEDDVLTLQTDLGADDTTGTRLRVKTNEDDILALQTDLGADDTTGVRLRVKTNEGHIGEVLDDPAFDGSLFARHNIMNEFLHHWWMNDTTTIHTLVPTVAQVVETNTSSTTIKQSDTLTATADVMNFSTSITSQITRMQFNGLIHVPASTEASNLLFGVYRDGIPVYFRLYPLKISVDPQTVNVTGDVLVDQLASGQDLRMDITLESATSTLDINIRDFSAHLSYLHNT